MVTNAQFPEQMETLTPVTQLYISVDAPDAPELKAVDRPLLPTSGSDSSRASTC